MTEYEEDFEDSSERMVASLYDVEQAIGRVEVAINEKWADIKTWITVPLVLYLLWSVPGEIWHAKWRYALTNDLDSSKVIIEKHPHDCDFFAAPLGEKYCHYERIVTTLQWATSTTGNPIVSYDEGKTWSTFTPEAGVTVPKTPTVQEVHITWEKKDE